MSDIIKSLGLYIENDGLPGAYVSAHDLREALDKLPVVYSNEQKDNWCNAGPMGCDSFKARLLGVEKIVKEPLRVEFELDCSEDVPRRAIDNLSDENYLTLTGKKWKVVVTEIQEGE